MLGLYLEGKDRIRFLSAVSEVQKTIPHEVTSHMSVMRQKADVLQYQPLLAFELDRSIMWMDCK